MKSQLIFASLLLLAFGAGCKDNPTSVAGTDTGGTPTPASNGKTDTTPAQPAVEVPSELRHAAFEYFAFGSAEPRKMVVTIPNQDNLEGEQTTTLVGVKDGEATYDITRTGGLKMLGTEQYLVTKDGVYAFKAGEEMVLPKKLELPADLTPGKSWSADSKFKFNGAEVRQKSTTKIVRTEKVQTKLGEFDALLVSETGTIHQGGVTTPMNGRRWLVKGVGIVKMEVKTKPKGGQEQTLVIEVTK